MDSLINWDNLNHARTHHSSSTWSSSGSASGTLHSFDHASELSGHGNPKSRNFESLSQVPDLNGMSQEYQLRALLALTSTNPNGLSGAPGSAPIVSQEEQFGHWRPVYDEKAKPALSITGTEIWAAQKSNPPQKNKSEIDWNVVDTKPLLGDAGSSAIYSMLKEKDNEWRNEGSWSGSGIQSNAGSDVDLISRRRSIVSSVDSNAGWGKTPIHQEKPWDLCQDGAVLETGGVLPLQGQQEAFEVQDLLQSCGLDVLREAFSSGDQLGAVDSRKVRDCGQWTPLEDVLKSANSDLLQAEIQKLTSAIDGRSSVELNHSRRGSSVSSNDGIMPLASLTGRTDHREHGVDPQLNVMSWMEKHKQLLSQKDDCNHGRLSSGLQSPSGWSSLTSAEKTPPVDNGTSLWSKPVGLEKPSDDSLSWTKMLKPAQSLPHPFGIDVSMPPPSFSSQMLSRGIHASSSSSVGANPLLNSYQTSKKVGSPLSILGGGLGPLSPDVQEKWPMLQQQQLGQKTWPGNHWSSNNTEMWTSMPRKVTSVGVSKPPQTRSRLIQQLVSMGFKKEDAQNALINHNMDVEKALVELIAKHRASMSLPTSSFDGPLHPLVGRQHQNVSITKDPTKTLLNSRPNLSVDVRGASANTTIDVNKLLSTPGGWERLLQTSSLPPSQVLSSVGNVPPGLPPLPSLSQQPLHSSFQHPSINLSASNALREAAEQYEMRRFSELALRKNLPECGQNAIHPEVDLSQIFAKQLSMNEQLLPHNNTATISLPEFGIRNAFNLADIHSSGPQSNPFLNRNLAAGPSGPADVEPKQNLHFDGFGGSSLILGGQHSPKAPVAENEEVLKPDDALPVQLFSANVKTGQTDEFPLKIKEFVPGVPWKWSQAAVQEKTEHVEEVPPVSGTTAFSGGSEWVLKDDENDLKSHSVQPPSKWIELKNIPDKLDDATLLNLCSKHGQVKVFTRENEHSLLVSYIKLEDAVAAQEKLNQHEIDGFQITAEFVKDWTTTENNADGLSLTGTSESLGYMTPGGLWIPPEVDTVYYDDADNWCEGLTESQWSGEENFDSATSNYPESNSQK